MRSFSKNRFFEPLFVATMLLATSGLSACALYDGLSSADSSSSQDARGEDGVSAWDIISSGEDGHSEDTRTASDASTPDDARDAQPDDGGDRDVKNSDSVSDISGNYPPDVEEPEVGFTDQICFDVAECNALPSDHVCASMSCKTHPDGGKRCHIEYKEAGEQCAEAEGVCDLPTLCSGSSAFCAPKRYVGNGNHCCMPGPGPSVVQGQCSGQVACQAAPGEGRPCGILEDDGVPSSYFDTDTKRRVTFEGVSFEGSDSRVLVVQPGETIRATIDFSWVVEGNSNWRVIFVFGVDGLFRHCLGPVGNHGQIGNYNPGAFENVTFTAPQEEGIYYLNSRLSAGDHCGEVRHGDAFSPRLSDSTLAVIYVVAP